MEIGTDILKEVELGLPPSLTLNPAMNWGTLGMSAGANESGEAYSHGASQLQVVTFS